MEFRAKSVGSRICASCTQDPDLSAALHSLISVMPFSKFEVLQAFACLLSSSIFLLQFCTPIFFVSHKEPNDPQDAILSMPGVDNILKYVLITKLRLIIK